MSLTKNDIEALALIMNPSKNAVEQSNVVEVLMKIAVAVCTAGILWLITSTADLQNKMIAMDINQKNTEKTISGLEKFTEQPRFTAKDFDAYMNPIEQRIVRNELILRERNNFMAETNARLGKVESNYLLIMQKLEGIKAEVMSQSLERQN